MAHGFHLAVKDAFDLIGENDICDTEDGIDSENEKEPITNLFTGKFSFAFQFLFFEQTNTLPP